jgi:hypothetical protein
MFVPPVMLKRYAPGEKLNTSDLRKIEIKIVFKMNDAVIGGGFQVPKDMTQKEVAERFTKLKILPELERVKNGIYSVDKTPWRDLNFDYYELIKAHKALEE